MCNYFLTVCFHDVVLFGVEIEKPPGLRCRGAVVAGMGDLVGVVEKV